ncbi:MAG: ATP-binding protein [Peptococcaceae bacterium]|jgi:anti-sigma regulatory factor (Ser/Thr protein kinase)|nr:ATP-binding protein [Peptococcaceae bacterium]
MDETIRLVYDVDGDNFATAGEASADVKRVLRQIGLPADFIRRVAIAMYEGEINMVIHARGGKALVEITPQRIIVDLHDIGPGIPDIPQAMQEGFSTAPDSIRSLGFGAGMGLPNMKRYADDIKVSSIVGEGTSVKLEFNVG